LVVLVPSQNVALVSKLVVELFAEIAKDTVLENAPDEYVNP
jgi:hypothetical protein